MKPSGISERIQQQATRALRAIDRGELTLDDALDTLAHASELRRSVEHLLLHVFRYRNFFRGIIAEFAAKPPAPDLQCALEVTLAQIYFQTVIAPQSAVNIAVTLAKKQHADKFVNALLRHALSHKKELPEAVKLLPQVVLKRWKREFAPAELAQLAQAWLAGADFTFRLERDFAVPSFAATPLPSPGFRFFRASPHTVLNSPEFERGEIYIQDPAASLAPSLADCAQVKKALDLCAAPGGKALMLAEKLSAAARLTAADRSARRQELTQENFARRQIPVELITATPQELCGSYDLVLADVPCTNTGVFRRRPDALWRFSSRSLAETVKLQQEILHEAARLTAPGGQLIYSTCSIEKEENSLQIERFLAAHADFELQEQHQLLPDLLHDGAFAAVLIRR